MDWQPYWRPGDLFCYWNSRPNTIYVILGFHRSRQPDKPVDWRDWREVRLADSLVANLGDGTLKTTPVPILDGAQVCKVIEGEH